MISASFQGILVTILVLGVLIAIHEAGHFLAAKSLKVPVRQFAIGFGPRIFGFRWNETEIRLNWIPLGGYCAFVDDEAEGKGDDTAGNPDLLRNRPIWQRTWVVSAGVIFNFVFAFLLLWVSTMAIGAPTGRETVAVNNVLPNSPAAAAGLQKGDRLLSVAGVKFEHFSDFQAELKRHKQEAIAVSVERNGQPLEVRVTPTAEGRLGFSPAIDDEREVVSNPVLAVGSAWQQQSQITGMLLNAFGQFFQEPQRMVTDTGGPIQIVAMGDQIFQVKPLLLIKFAVLLSIELAIINILPLPALDGGHLVLLLLEKLRGAPLPRRLEEGIMMSGFMLIMGLGMVLIFKDILTVPGMYKPAPAVSTPAASPSTVAPPGH